MLPIPFQDSRSNGNRRWSDLLRCKQLLVDEIDDLIDRCEMLNGDDLLKLRRTINRKLNDIRHSD